MRPLRHLEEPHWIWALARRLTTCLFMALAVFGCGPASAEPTKELDTVVLQHFWIQGTLFAGFYAADHNGYYAEEGISVKMVEGGVGVDYFTPVADGTAHFGYAGADELILARANGMPLRAVATIYRRSPSVFVARAETGITRPQDFVGRKIRVTPQTAAHFHAMMAKAGITPDQYVEVVLPSDLDLFASGEADVWNVYINNFAVELEQAGYDLNYVYPDDYGVHFYADTLFIRDGLLSENPDLVLRFVRASLRGWTWAVENPEAVGPLVQLYWPEADADLEAAKMTAALPLINTGEDFIGWMEPDVWAGMEATLREQGVLAGPLAIEDVYTLGTLVEIYAP